MPEQMIFFPSFNPFNSVLLVTISVTRQLFVCAFAEVGRRMGNKGDVMFVSTHNQARDKEEDGVPEVTFCSKGGKKIENNAFAFVYSQVHFKLSRFNFDLLCSKYILISIRFFTFIF